MGFENWEGHSGRALRSCDGTYRCKRPFVTSASRSSIPIDNQNLLVESDGISLLLCLARGGSLLATKPDHGFHFRRRMSNIMAAIGFVMSYQISCFLKVSYGSCMKPMYRTG